MTRYRLPEAMGGAIIHCNPAPEGVGRDDEVSWIDPATGTKEALPTGLLTEVPPPVPDEPGPGPGVWLINGDACQRTEQYDDQHWCVVGSTALYRWPDLWAEIGGPDVTIQPLVPLSTVDWSRFPEADVACPAHGDSRCLLCHRNPDSCAAGPGLGPCGSWAKTGKHWDTCPNRVRGPLEIWAAPETEPLPKVDEVELPWTGQSMLGVLVHVKRDRDVDSATVDVAVDGRWITVSYDTARAMAVALIAASTGDGA